MQRTFAGSSLGGGFHAQKVGYICSIIYIFFLFVISGLESIKSQVLVFLHCWKIFLHFEISVKTLICMLNFNKEEREKNVWYGNFHSHPTLILS